MRQRLVKYFFLLLATATFAACSSDDNKSDFRWGKSGSVKDFIGTLRYNSDIGKWGLYPDKAFNNPFLSQGELENSAFVIIENMSEEIEKYQNQVVIANGDYEWVSDETYNPNFDAVLKLYTIHITGIRLYSPYKTRALVGYSDTICGTIATLTPNKKESFKNLSNNNYIQDYNVRVFVHVIRPSSITIPVPNLKETISSETMNTLYYYYGSTPISFTLIGNDYIDSDVLFNYTTGLEDSCPVFTHNRHTDAIDIYVFAGNPNNLQVQGLAEDIPSTAFLTNYDGHNNVAAAHEMGHCLGLYHTHHGTRLKQDGTSAEGGSPEFVDGSNSTIAGDFIADTPADPCYWFNGNYNGGSITDAHGDKYNPDASLIMSYSNASSQNRFSNLQLIKMYQTLYSNDDLQNVLIKDIQGPDFIQQYASFSIDCPNTYTVNWSIVCETFSNQSSTPTSTITETKTGKEIIVYNSNTTASSQKYTITANIITPYGSSWTKTKVVHHVIISSSTGRVPYSTEVGIGNLNFNSYTDINIYPGGTLYLNYTEPSGSDAVLYPDDYYFNINDGGYNLFTKDSSSNRVFYLSQSAGTGTLSGLIQVGVTGGGMALLPVRFKIKQHNQTLSNDSISILKDEEYEENL